MFKFTKDIIDKALSFSEFMDYTKTILSNENNLAPYNNQNYLDYTRLNYNRIEKILRNFQLDKKLYNALSENIDDWTWVLINEPWCGDGSFIQPVIYAMTLASGGSIDFKVVLRDENSEIMNSFLTNGGMAIPKLVCLDKELNVIDSWGPRPNELKEKFISWKNEGLLEDTSSKIKFVNRWYLKDKNQSIQKEFIDLIKKWKKVKNDK